MVSASSLRNILILAAGFTAAMPQKDTANAALAKRIENAAVTGINWSGEILGKRYELSGDAEVQSSNVASMMEVLTPHTERP